MGAYLPILTPAQMRWCQVVRTTAANSDEGGLSGPRGVSIVGNFVSRNVLRTYIIYEYAALLVMKSRSFIAAFCRYFKASSVTMFLYPSEKRRNCLFNERARKDGGKVDRLQLRFIDTATPARLKNPP